MFFFFYEDIQGCQSSCSQLGNADRANKKKWENDDSNKVWKPPKYVLEEN